MKTGWIFKIKGTQTAYSSSFYCGIGGFPTTLKLSKAIVLSTRKKARENKLYCETLRQVELSQRGKPKRIIGRG